VVSTKYRPYHFRSRLKLPFVLSEKVFMVSAEISVAMFDDRAQQIVPMATDAVAVVTATLT